MKHFDERRNYTLEYLELDEMPKWSVIRKPPKKGPKNKDPEDIVKDKRKRKEKIR